MVTLRSLCRPNGIGVSVRDQRLCVRHHSALTGSAGTLTPSIDFGVAVINAPASAPGQLSAASDAFGLAPKPLRVALLGYRSAPFSGGQGIYLKYLSRALAKQGHHVTVFSGPPYPELDDAIPLEKLPSLDLYTHGLDSVSVRTLATDRLGRIEWLSKLTGGFVEPWVFGERVRAALLPRMGDFDIVHDNQTLADGILDLQHAGMPVVTTIHHPITRDLRLALAAEQRWHYRLLIKRWHSFLTMQGRVARSLDNIVTVSSASRRDIVSDFGVAPSRVHVLHNGVDADLFSPQPDIQRLPYQIMATASADTPTKGLHVLLAAAAKLRASYPKLALTLIGRPRPGGDTENLVAQLGLEAQVRWVKDADHPTIVKLYAESTLAVVPSLYEGFGLPAVEAMACGVPLISSDGGALAEVVGEAGVVVPAGDVDALARAIDGLLGDQKARDELGRAARARVEAHFSWDVCARGLTDYYRRRVLPC